MLLSINATSQQQIRNIQTTEAMNIEAASDNELRNRRSVIEGYYESVAVESLDEVVTLPLVFHVVYNDDIDALPQESITQQIEVLNDDFAGNFSDDANNGGDSNIRFCLASDIDIKAINYHKVDQSDWSTGNAIKKSELGGFNPINPSNAINIWVTNLRDEVGGYSMMPGVNSEHDGIVLDFEFFGIKNTADSNYGKGKSLTHLMGNYLGLYPLWGGVRCQDDFVDDTPIHNAPNNSCYEKNHYTTCDPGTLEMTGNFMDNGFDDCMEFFTAGQIIRMRKTIMEGGPREALASGSVECAEEQLGMRSHHTPNLKLNLFPNPATQMVYLDITIPSMETDQGTVNIYNRNGKLQESSIVEFSSTEERISVLVDDLIDGVYLIEFVYNDEKITKKFSVVNN